MSIPMLTCTNQIVRREIQVKEEATRLPPAFTPVPGRAFLAGVRSDDGESSDATSTGWDMISLEAAERTIATSSIISENALVPMHVSAMITIPDGDQESHIAGLPSTAAKLAKRSLIKAKEEGNSDTSFPPAPGKFDRAGLAPAPLSPFVEMTSLV